MTVWEKMVTSISRYKEAGMTITVSTDYITNKGPLEIIIDGSRTTYWGALDAQAAGKSIVFSF